ncbi:BsaWI family type II restriction enzyme [Thermosipho africanus]|uniref:BsaWI family type II restriction enzyme n=1 Tax=Thermosipho africanus TaxID=2421 RepID=UPI000E0AE345|nr:BsaWI family type II restriction enzyme [Thermosipho africanus]
MNTNDVSKILESEKEKYVREKSEKYISEGLDKSTAVNKANQSWRAYVGSKIQEYIFNQLKSALENQGLKIITDKELKSKNLPEELEQVKRLLSIDYGDYLFLPDADIIVYKKIPKERGIKNIKILAIVSVKNSFRERGFETTYWKKKLSESKITSHIKVFIATPDKDNEISYRLSKNNNPRKMRIILEYELDGIYFLKDNFEKTDKTKHFDEIINDILKLVSK